MQRLSRGPKLPLLRAQSFRFDRRCKSLSVSATRPVRHSAPLRLSMIAKSHEVDLVDTWRADSQSLSVARRARNYPMCENALARDRDGINLSQKCLLVREVCKADSILPGSSKILLAAEAAPTTIHPK